MPSLAIHPVDGRSQRRRFVRLPWSIYRDDPCWMPPLVHSQEELLGFRPHPFYERSRSRSFLATRGGRDVGRITAIVNAGHVERYGERRGFFGFFECEDDEAAARRLFEAAGDWLHGQGMTCVRGPANPSLNYEWGLLIDGFDTPPFFMMTHARPYYPRLVEAAGFRKAQDMHAYGGRVSQDLRKIDAKLYAMAEAATERFGVKIRPLDTRRFAAEVRMFLDLYNSSMEGMWGFVPLSDGEVRHMAASLKHLIVPELALVAEIEGKPVGAVLSLLDYNPRIKEIGGRLLPVGFLRLLWNRRGIRRVRILAANVVPEYQAWGIGLVLLNALEPRIVDFGLEELEFSWVLESNQLSRRSLERGGARITKTYRIYQDDPPA